jgi:two-component system, LuxR family, response regulator FixJ
MHLTSSQIVRIVDDDEGMRTWLLFVLDKANISSVAFASGAELLGSFDSTCTGCLVVDFEMPEMSGLQLVKEIRGRGFMIPFLIITGRGSVSLAVEAMIEGAVTVIEKPFGHVQFVEHVRKALAQDLQQREATARQNQLKAQLDLLTAREREVLELVVQGWLSKQIAKSLGISSKTVEVHRSNISKKLGMTSVAQLVKLVVSVKHQIPKDK